MSVELRALRRALAITSAQIMRLKRRGMRDFGSRNEHRWPERYYTRMRMLKDRAKEIRARIADLAAAYAMEAAE